MAWWARRHAVCRQALEQKIWQPAGAKAVAQTGPSLVPLSSPSGRAPSGAPVVPIRRPPRGLWGRAVPGAPPEPLGICQASRRRFGSCARWGATLTPSELGLALAPGTRHTDASHVIALHRSGSARHFDPPVPGGHTWTCLWSAPSSVPECPSTEHHDGVPGYLLGWEGSQQLLTSPDRGPGGRECNHRAA